MFPGETYELRNDLVVRPFKTHHVIPSQVSNYILHFLDVNFAVSSYVFQHSNVLCSFDLSSMSKIQYLYRLKTIVLIEEAEEH